jgi:chemotaxis protein methyltransferase CheR
MFSETDKLKDILADKFGFIVKDKQDDSLKKIIHQRTKLHSFTNSRDYLHWILEDENHPEWQFLVDRFTIRETYFFRNKHQFEFLENHIIPEIITKSGVWHWDESGYVLPEINIFSAGCSTGEESYSIAISFAENIKFLRNWKIRIDAVDISSNRVEFAKAGVYPSTYRMQSSLNEMDPDYLEKYFDLTHNGHYKVKDKVRNLINFRQMNLKSLFEKARLLLPKYDLIFCRNVMIYFAYQDQAAMVRTLENSLNPGGYLMTGDAEALHLYDHNFKLVDSSLGLIYQKPL